MLDARNGTRSTLVFVLACFRRRRFRSRRKLISASNRSASTPVIVRRSEEHTSELQSHHDLVCRLLLEKYGDPHVLHSFPTLRSSDLLVVLVMERGRAHGSRDARRQERDEIDIGVCSGVLPPATLPFKAEADHRVEPLGLHARDREEIGRAHV